MESEAIIKQSLGEKYELLSVIGKGGMATVYKAIKKSLNRPVALKVIHQNLVHDDEFIKRFIQEAQVCASLNHPNIITVYDVDSINTVHFMSMEYLKGMTLREKIQSHGSLEVEETIDLIAPIAQALGYIHQRGIVHRDVKSSNIFVTSEGRPVLMDFGIVYSEGRESLSQFGTVLGTPEYMSPEQAEGKVKSDGRSDIYSLGVIMFECLTGRLPFHSENYISTIVQVIQNPPPPIRSINSLVPEWLTRIVEGCLVKDRNLRISDGIILANALRKKEHIGITQIGDTNDQLTRKIETGEIQLNKVSKKEEGKSQLHGAGKKQRSLLLGIFVTFIIVFIILGVMILRPEKLQTNSLGVGVNTRVTIPEKVLLLPKITTTQVETIHTNSAIISITVSDDGGSSVISRGVCWAATHNPTISESHTTDGPGIGSFNSSITGLTPNTRYYLRAYATNGLGTAFSEEQSFTTLPAPVENMLSKNSQENFQTSMPVTKLNSNDQTGIVTDINGNGYKTLKIGNHAKIQALVQQGDYYLGKNYPEEALAKYKEALKLTPSNISILDKIVAATIARDKKLQDSLAQAETIPKEINDIRQVTNDESVVNKLRDADGNEYKTVKIGNQVWMAENLKTTKYKDGIAIPDITDNNAWRELTTPAYCWYDNDAATKKTTYGALYNWYAVKTGKLCPSGWHVPTDYEWTTLTAYLGGETVAGGKLKETGKSHWAGPNTGATNVYSFTALPGGGRGYNGWFINVGNCGNWWSSTEFNSYAWIRNVNYDFTNVYRYSYDERSGFSVRCVRD